MPDSSSHLGDIPSWIALAFSATSLLWQSLASRSAKRDRSTLQKKARIDQLVVDVDELTSQAIAYWIKPENVAQSEGMLIVVKIRDLSRRITAYKAFLWDGAETDFAKLRMQITGGNFQVKNRQAFAPDSSFVKSFVLSAGDIKSRLRTCLDGLDDIGSR